MSRRKRIMVCVTQQKSCEHLLEKGAEHRKHPEDALFMVHAVKENWRYFGQLKEGDAMEYLYDIAKTFDASINVMKTKDIEETLAEFANKHHIDVIVMGASRETDQQQNMIHRLYERLHRKIQIDIVQVDDLTDLSSDGGFTMEFQKISSLNV